MFANITFTFVVVETMIATVGIMAAFEYDKWRTDNGAVVTWYERLFTQWLFISVTMVILYTVAHKRFRLGANDTYNAPIFPSDMEEWVKKLHARREDVEKLLATV